MAAGTVLPVVLAAGDSTRMGYPKALLPLGDETFLTAILGKLENIGLPQPLVILGRDAARIKLHIAGRRLDVVINPDPGRGQLSSIQLAVANAEACHSGCLVWPVDQPAVPENLVRELVNLFVNSGARIALPRCGIRRGHPAVFHRSLYEELLSLPAGEGAKGIVRHYQEQIAELPTDDVSTIDDVDTPEDYCRLTGVTLKSAIERVSR